jgi:hypothetical protein
MAYILATVVEIRTTLYLARFLVPGALKSAIIAENV